MDGSSATYGYPPAALAAAIATLDALSAADEAQNVAVGAAKQATAASPGWQSINKVIRASMEARDLAQTREAG
jgi:hypothetical protein